MSRTAVLRGNRHVVAGVRGGRAVPWLAALPGQQRVRSDPVHLPDTGIHPVHFTDTGTDSVHLTDTAH